MPGGGGARQVYNAAWIDPPTSRPPCVCGSLCVNDCFLMAAGGTRRLVHYYTAGGYNAPAAAGSGGSLVVGGEGDCWSPRVGDTVYSVHEPAD